MSFMIINYDKLQEIHTITCDLIVNRKYSEISSADNTWGNNAKSIDGVANLLWQYCQHKNMSVNDMLFVICYYTRKM